MKKPTYLGGKEAFKKFIGENLRYPAQALAKGIQGTVLLQFTVSDTGEVSDTKVLNGIGYGCDEEALRLARLLKYEKVKNRGMRLRVSHKLKIHFRLPPKTSVQYRYSVKKTEQKVRKVEKPKTYSYNISW